MDDDVLSEEQLRELTGTERPTSQIKTLEKHGISFVIRRDGKPRTTFSLIHSAFQNSSMLRPDWSKLG